MEQMIDLVEQLNLYAYQYYVLDAPTLSDGEYDRLFEELVQLEKELGRTLPDSPTHRIGGEPLARFLPHTHAAQLWSLDKVKTREEFSDWEERIHKLLPGEAISYVLQYKIDGLTINLTYDEGRLIQAATRGNGRIGESILPQVRTIKSVPLSVPYLGFFEVQGEGFMPLSAFDRYNQTAEEPLKNARNGAAGALRNLDPQQTAQRNLDAFFYHIGILEGHTLYSQEEMETFLQNNHLKMPPNIGIFTNSDDLFAAVEEIAQKRTGLDFLTDGLVVKVTNFDQRERLGYTDRFPRWAIAIKFAAEEATTFLRSVSWDVGRSGKLTPLAHLDPVDIGGITISHATLNNPGDIRRKGVKIGGKVWVRRSNDVIPEIMGTVDQEGTEIFIPEVCPYCGSIVEKRGAHIFCTNSGNCRRRRLYELAHFASRAGMDIEGLNEKTIGVLLDQLSVSTPDMLYELTREELLRLPGFREKRADNLLEALAKSKTPDFDRFLNALGIPNVGRKTARDLATAYSGVWELMHADVASLNQIRDVGDIVAQSIVDYFRDATHIHMLEKLHELGVNPVSIHTSKEGILLGESIVFTGALRNRTRNEAQELAQALGADVQSSVGKHTTLLVAGERAGSKLQRAQSMGIRVMTEEEFEWLVQR